MSGYYSWAELSLAVFFAIIAVAPVSEVSCASVPLQHQGLLPVGKKVGSSIQHASSSIKSKRKKTSHIPISRSVSINQVTPQQLIDSEDSDYDVEIPAYKSELKGNEILSSPPDLVRDVERRVPYYDCPLFSNENNLDGKAIIKPDPYDCSCCYYCNWGIHYVQCCAWPLLWNDRIKSCDWHWRVSCLTYDGWDDK